jgi:hypothetical protein
LVRVDAVYEPFEDMENDPETSHKDNYRCGGWALLDTAADCSYVCSDTIGVTLDIAKRYMGFFTVKYVSHSPAKLTIPHGRFAGVAGLSVESVAKLVNRESLPNQAEGIINNLILGQKVFLLDDGLC